MPKAILEFNLPEEKDEFDMTNNVMKYYSIILHVGQQLRSIIKYDENLTNEEHKVYEKIYRILNDEIYSSGVDIEF
jgi:hypothetical protein